LRNEIPGFAAKNAANPGLCSTTPSALKYRKADGYTDFFDTLWEARGPKFTLVTIGQSQDSFDTF
jgi:hypothetical protein